MWDFFFIHIKLPLKPSTTPHKPFSSNLQRNLAHILYRRNHQNEFSPNSCHTIRIYSPNPCRAPLGNSPPKPCSTVRNIHLIFVLSLGKDFQHNSSAPLIAKFSWRCSFHNWSVRDLFDWSLPHTSHSHQWSLPRTKRVFWSSCSFLSSPLWY